MLFRPSAYFFGITLVNAQSFLSGFKMGTLPRPKTHSGETHSFTVSVEATHERSGLLVPLLSGNTVLQAFISVIL